MTAAVLHPMLVSWGNGIEREAHISVDTNRETHFRKLERMYAAGPCNAYFRAVMSISRGRAEVEIDVREDFFHSAGAAHGSVYFKLMDDAAFFACSSLVQDRFLLTVQFDVQLIRPIARGTMKAVGEFVNRSPTLFFARAEVYDERGRRLAAGTGTFQKSRIPLSPEVGYQ